jgi:LL-diaminopimelate aminotransferase
VDLIYLCFPNNPTGAVATKSQLKQWVDYARKEKALILFDAAYEAFIYDQSIPIASMRLRVPANAQLNSEAFQKLQVSPEPAVHIQ